MTLAYVLVVLHLGHVQSAEAKTIVFIKFLLLLFCQRASSIIALKNVPETRFLKKR